jgi:C4-dicarboxylate-specific signal transduction histidine kinase
MSYGIGLTALSLGLAIVVTSGSFYVISRPGASSVGLVLSGIVMGLGIISMHYTGMAAMHGPADITYDRPLVALSVAVAIGAATAALWLAFRTANPGQRILAAVVMGLAIAGMHYIGMAAASFTAHAPLDPAQTAADLDQTSLALAVAGITFVILGCALVASVSEHRRAEEALREARADLARIHRVALLGEMTTTIAHEVKQPIAAVVMSAGAGLRWLAAQPPDLAEVRQILERIVRDGNRASEVIDRIRALVQNGPVRQDRIDVNETILDAIALTRSELQRNGVTLQTRLASDLPPISGDRVQLQQVILNLVMNAVEAMGELPEGPRALLVSSAPDGSNAVLVVVRDSGPGLAGAPPEHLFEAFYTTKPHGIGMGLAISRSIVEAHGGRLWAMPNLPRGAILQFSLPVDHAPASWSPHTPSLLRRVS